MEYSCRDAFTGFLNVVISISFYNLLVVNRCANDINEFKTHVFPTSKHVFSLKGSLSFHPHPVDLCSVVKESSFRTPKTQKTEYLM